MKKKIKRIIKYFVNIFVNILFLFNIGRYFLEKLQLNIGKKRKKVFYKNNEYFFHVPNRINLWRTQTFLTKEPDTIRWIENFKVNSVFWDVGANIGLYSCFASRQKKAKTFAFEPSVFNLEVLSKNIYCNNLSDKIIIIPLSLTSETKISSFNMSKIEVGGARSSFSENYDEEGNVFNPVFKYNTLGISGNDIVKKFNIDKPDYIKIDVDGIEYLVLNGLSEILDDTSSILIEVTESFKSKKKKIKEFLEHRGFTLEKNEFSEKDLSLYNQIWNRN